MTESPPITYHLLPGQSKIDRMRVKHKAFIAGLGAGKTWYGGFWAAQQAQTPGNGMILAPTYRMLEDVTLPQFLHFMEAHRIPHIHQKGRGRVETAFGKIYTRSAEKPDRIRGPNCSWAWGDEAGMWGEKAWRILLGRLRLYNARSLLTTTPAGFNWLHEYFVERGNARYGYVQASTRENKHLDDDYVADLESDYTDEFAAQEIDGQFVAFEGMIYGSFRRNVHAEVAFETPDEWRRMRAVDFGFTNPFVCLFATVDEDDRIFVYDEWYKNRTLLDGHATAIKDIEKRKVAWSVSDHDAQDAAELHAKGIPTMPAKKDVMAGIRAVKARFKIQDDGRPRLFIHPRCVQTIKELGMYRWKPNTGEKNEPEEPLKKNDHAMDALRYLVMQVDHGGFVMV